MRHAQYGMHGTEYTIWHTENLNGQEIHCTCVWMCWLQFYCSVWSNLIDTSPCIDENEVYRLSNIRFQSNWGYRQPIKIICMKSPDWIWKLMIATSWRLSRAGNCSFNRHWAALTIESLSNPTESSSTSNQTDSNQQPMVYIWSCEHQHLRGSFRSITAAVMMACTHSLSQLQLFLFLDCLQLKSKGCANVLTPSGCIGTITWFSSLSVSSSFCLIGSNLLRSICGIKELFWVARIFVPVSTTLSSKCYHLPLSN
jgi:hypothetical protein